MNLNWSHLLRENFGYEGLSDLSTIDLICLYIDRCQKKKYVFCAPSHLYIRIGNTVMRGHSEGLKAPFPLHDIDIRRMEEIASNGDNLFVKYNNCLMVRGANQHGELGIGNSIAQNDLLKLNLGKYTR